MLTITMMSCTSGVNNNDDSTLVDTVKQEVDTAIQVTGVAVDGAMNSVSIKVGDDTIEFAYPELEASHRASWDINDTLTVQYFETENGDSVINITNENA